MNQSAAIVIYALAMVAIIVGVDVAFLRDHLWLRLAVNVGVVAVFGAVYMGFIRQA